MIKSKISNKEDYIYKALDVTFTHDCIIKRGLFKKGIFKKWKIYYKDIDKYYIKWKFWGLFWNRNIYIITKDKKLYKINIVTENIRWCYWDTIIEQNFLTILEMKCKNKRINAEKE